MRDRILLLLLCLCLSVGMQAQRRSISVLGDSYSTYENFLPAGNVVWYHEPYSAERTDVTDVTQTWWHLLCQKRGFKLDTNNSYSGATICNTGYDGNDYTDRSFITRASNLGCPDIILVFGGTNDSWANSPLGEMKHEGYTREDLFTFRPAVSYLARYLTKRYPNTDVYFILNTELKPEVGQAMQEACEHWGAKLITLHDITKKAGHPDVAGMREIARQVSARVK